MHLTNNLFIAKSLLLLIDFLVQIRSLALRASFISSNSRPSVACLPSTTALAGKSRLKHASLFSQPAVPNTFIIHCFAFESPIAR